MATTDNVNKDYLLSIEDRISIINNSLFKDLKFNKKRILVIPFEILTVELCKKYKASIIIRGLRAVSDFEYEFQLAGMNKKLNSEIETIFFHPSEEKINLGDFIADRISLDEPMKPICDSNCKGLCTQCGVNINKSSCDCKLDETDSPWDELKKIDFNLK